MSVDKTTKKDTLDHLVDDLCENLGQAKPLFCPFKAMALWIFASAAYCAIVVTFITGIRPDLYDKPQDAAYIFELTLGALMGLSALCASQVLRTPGEEHRRIIHATPVIILGVFLLWSVIRLYAEGFSPLGMHFKDCLLEGLMMGIVPAAVLVFFSRKGATTAPYLMGFMNSLAVASFGYVALRLSCDMDHVENASLYHFLPFIVGGAAIGLIARRLYKW